MVNSNNRSQYAKTTHSDSELPSPMQDDADYSGRDSSFSAMGNSFIDDQPRMSTEMSPMMMSPWNQVTPFTKSQWSQQSENLDEDPTQKNPLIGSLVREEGHIYSLATRGDLLYTGSDSKNIRVWKNLKEFSGFKSASGLVKAIVIAGEKIFTGHQDGKIRVWKVSLKNPSIHKRSGSLPTLKDIFKASIKPSNYVEVKKHKSYLWIKHSDAISCLSLNDEHGILYSASWDRTFKVWRISDSKCLESVAAHDDAVNSVVASSDGLIFTGKDPLEFNENGNNINRNAIANSPQNKMEGFEGKGGEEFPIFRKTFLCFVRKTGWKKIEGIYFLFYKGRITPCSNLSPLYPYPPLLPPTIASKLTLKNDITNFIGSADGTVKVWRREMQGKGTKHFLMETLLKQECAVTALAVDPTGAILYCGSSDGLVNFWERGKSIAHGGVLRSHKLAVLCLEARARLVFSGSADKTICVWRRIGTTHTCLSILTGHSGPVKCLAVEDDKEANGQKFVVYSGSLDKSVKVWSVSDQEMVSPFGINMIPATTTYDGDQEYT